MCGVHRSTNNLWLIRDVREMTVQDEIAGWAIYKIIGLNIYLLITDSLGEKESDYTLVTLWPAADTS